MFPINAEQHSKILGFALIAYGLQFFSSTLELFNTISEFWDAYSYIGWKLIFDPILRGRILDFSVFLIFLFSGVSILYFKNRLKFVSLAFVFIALTYFPLGTILSFYTLCYLFVISENKIVEQELSKET